jgi:glycosyltransferase involved in cell wall biosynthesis
MRILFFTNLPTSLASSRIRVGQYLPLFDRAGTAYTAMHYAPSTRFLTSTATGGLRRLREQAHKLAALFRVLAAAPNYDIVFLQKTVPPIIFQRLVRQRNCNIVFDFDDAVFTLPADSRVPPSVHARHRRKLEHILGISSCTIVGNSYLAEYARRFNANVFVVPSAVDCSRFRPLGRTRGQQQFIVGWCGTGEQHLPHISLLMEPLERIGREYPIVFRLIGSMGSRKIQEAFARARHYSVEIVDWVDPQDIAVEIAQFDIGVMPLVDDEWARGKCGYKALEYMACGIPTICSPVGINRDIVRDGENGFLASDSDEWTDKLKRLVEDQALRLTLGKRGRQTVEQGYSLESCFAKLHEVLLKVVAEPSLVGGRERAWG